MLPLAPPDPGQINAFRLSAFVALLGGIGGLLMSVETVGHFMDLMPGSPGRTFEALMILVLLLTRFTLGAWLVLLGVMLTLRAVRSRRPFSGPYGLRG